jgi:hypothetical protein
MVGPGADPSTVITGTQSAESSAWDIPLSTIPVGVSNSGALSLSGNNTTTLSAGI